VDMLMKTKGRGEFVLRSAWFFVARWRRFTAAGF
jgi:hypothetical protein